MEKTAFVLYFTQADKDEKEYDYEDEHENKNANEDEDEHADEKLNYYGKDEVYMWESHERAHVSRFSNVLSLRLHLLKDVGYSDVISRGCSFSNRKFLKLDFLLNLLRKKK